MTLLRMWRGEKIRVARINSLLGNPPLLMQLQIYARKSYFCKISEKNRCRGSKEKREGRTKDEIFQFFIS